MFEIMKLFALFNLKLDAGSTERICLTSRDEHSVLVVSYHDLKACLETAFNDLTQAGMRQ